MLAASRINMTLSLCLQLFRLKWSISTNISMILLTFHTDVHDFQKMNPNDSKDHLTFPLAPTRGANVCSSIFSDHGTENKWLNLWCLINFKRYANVMVISIKSDWGAFSWGSHHKHVNFALVLTVNMELVYSYVRFWLCKIVFCCFELR